MAGVAQCGPGPGRRATVTGPGCVEHIGVTLHSGVGLPPTADIHRTHRDQPFTTQHTTSFS